eukprot:TRINITY_DN3650_c0_g1_i1.p1 TRINITY_DN3650_c0_g1~~TRINITY_DN3650_c0_g1_i1.p1  ORF type:complete len:565 (-),score=81.64 TRINITY_DN3650_c0_g1_i1:134-1828(-)
MSSLPNGVGGKPAPPHGRYPEPQSHYNQYGSNLAHGALDLENLRRTLKTPAASAKPSTMRNPGAEASRRHMPSHSPSAGLLAVPQSDHRSTSVSPSTSPPRSLSQPRAQRSIKKETVPPLKNNGGSMSPTTVRALACIKEMTYSVPKLLAPLYESDPQFEAALTSVAKSKRRVSADEDQVVPGASAMKRKPDPERAASVSPPSNRGKRIEKMESNGRDRAPKKRKLDATADTKPPPGKLAEGSSGRSSKVTAPTGESRDAKRQKRDIDEEQHSDTVQQNPLKPVSNVTTTGGDTQSKTTSDDKGAYRPTSSRREPSTERPLPSTILTQEARKLKHHADAEYKVNPVEALDCYISSGLKFLECAREMEVEYEAKHEQHKSPLPMYKATASFFDNCGHMCLSHKETARSSLCFRSMAVCLARRLHLQKNKLRQVQLELQSQLASKTQHTSPPLPVHGMRSGAQTATTTASSPPYKSVSSPVAGEYGTSGTESAPALSFMVEQVDDILKIFDAWNRADVNSQQTKIADLPVPHTMDKFVNSPTLLTASVITYVRKALDIINGSEDRK